MLMLNHRKHIKTSAIFLMSIGLTALVFVLRPPFKAKANGPIPFSEGFNTFTSAGFSPNPGLGQLDSDIWIVTGLSDGPMAFGDTQTTGDFARGLSPGAVAIGGIYAFDVGVGNYILGVQPGDADFTPGDIILRLQNNTGTTLTQLDITYDIWYLNDGDWASSLNLSYSPDNLTYIPLPALDFATPQALDALGWQSTPRTTTITGLNIANGAFFYLRWTGNDLSGTGERDEYGLDNVQILPISDIAPFVVATTPTDGAINIPLDTNIVLNFSENVTVTTPWFDITCTTSGSHTATVSGGPQSYTLNPDIDFSNGESCSLIINQAQVVDQDGTPDNMAADYTFNFTTATAPTVWIINEIHADPDPTNGDANGDGLVSTTQDEFVEIVNNSGSTADISNWTLADGVGVRHTFPPSTIIPDQCAVVVFSGGTPTGTFGGVMVQTASTGQLGLNNTGDTLTLNDGTIDQAVYTYGAEGGNNQSLTRDPDITGPDPLVEHSLAMGSGGTLYSPGTKVDASLFGVCGPPDQPPAVTATVPISEATGIAITTTINIQFSEVVSTTASTFALECPAGTPIAFGVAPVPPGNASNFTLNPAANLPYSTTCLATVKKDQITDLDGTPDNMATDYAFTFDTEAAPTPAAVILISEFLYDGVTPSTEGDEFVELCNPNSTLVDLTGYKLGDEEIQGGGESMYYLPPGTTLAPDACLVIAKNAADFQNRFGIPPDFEVSALTKYTAWAGGNWSLANTGDELLVLGPDDQILDSIAYRNGAYATLHLEPDATAPAPHSLQRIWPFDTDSMPNDFVRTTPTPGIPTVPPSPPAVPPPPATLPGGMNAYWGDLHAHTTYSDGAGPPFYALAMARAAGLHYYSITDHGWWLTPVEWDSILTQTISATVPGQFVALRGVEWSHKTVGHIGVFNSDTLLSRTAPNYDTLAELYDWLAANPNAIAQFNHPDPTFGGTFNDFAFNPGAANRIFLQEIGNSANAYTTYEPSFLQSNMAGWHVAPTNNSDIHTADWGLGTPRRTGIVAPALTEADLLAAMRARRVFATEDSNLALALRVDGAWMGSVLTATGPLSLTVDVVDPDPESITIFLYDTNLLLASVPLATSTGQWSTQVEALPGHFFWVKAVQADGDTAYSAPVWLAGQAPPDTLVINELLPAPGDVDWDGDGTADFNDEWVEIFNPLDRPVGLGGWRLRDATGVTYDIPLGPSIPAGGFVVFYKAQTGIALNNGGDTLTLIHPNGTVIDSFAYDHSPGRDDVWCRLPDAGSTWSEYCLPTPGASNIKRPRAEPLRVKIFDAKRLTLDAWVIVKGNVTAPPDLLGSRVMYIQDDTGGIRIYLPKDHRLSLNLGDEVEVEGNLDIYRGEFEIEVDERSDVSFQEPGLPPPPLPIATTSLLEPYEGMLIMLQGQVVHFRGRTTMWVDDGTDWAKVVILQRTGIRKPFIDIGTPLIVIGIASQSSGDNPTRNDYRLLPRYQTDLVLPETPPPPSDWPLLLPETGKK